MFKLGSSPIGSEDFCTAARPSDARLNLYLKNIVGYSYIDISSVWYIVVV